MHTLIYLTGCYQRLGASTMTPRTLTLPVAGSHIRILMLRSALVSLLGLSCAVGLSVAASNSGVIGAFLDLLTISFLLLCPVCAKGAGNRAVIALGAITGTTAIMGWLSKLTIGGGSSSWFGNAAWGAIQILVIGLAISSYRANSD